MADHVYKIVIDFNQIAPEKTPEEIEAERQAKFNKEFFGRVDGNFDAKKWMGSFGSMLTVSASVAVAQNIFSHEMQRVARYTGSQQAQDLANASLSIIKKTLNPIGTMINTAYELEQRAYERQWESIGLQLYRERGGVSLNRSRTEV